MPREWVTMPRKWVYNATSVGLQCHVSGFTMPRLWVAMPLSIEVSRKRFSLSVIALVADRLLLYFLASSF